MVLELVVLVLVICFLVIILFWVFKSVVNGFDFKLVFVLFFKVVVLSNGFCMFLYKRLSMLKFFGEDFMLFIVLFVFRIILRMSLGFRVVFIVWRSVVGLLSMWVSFGLRFMILRIWGLFMIKLWMILGLFIMFWVSGMFKMFFIMLGFWVNCVCKCFMFGSLVLNNLLSFFNLFKLSSGNNKVLKLDFSSVLFLLELVFVVMAGLVCGFLVLVVVVLLVEVFVEKLRIKCMVWFVFSFVYY